MILIINTFIFILIINIIFLFKKYPDLRNNRSVEKLKLLKDSPNFNIKKSGNHFLIKSKTNVKSSNKIQNDKLLDFF